MNKLSIVSLTICVAIFFFAIGFKVGDYNGFNDGYKVGYIYDCQAEIRQLKSAHEDLKKSINFAQQKSEQVQEENFFLKRRAIALRNNSNAIEDSIRLVPEVAKRNDSLRKYDKKGGQWVDPYTGKVEKGVLRMLNDLKGEK